MTEAPATTDRLQTSKLAWAMLLITVVCGLAAMTLYPFTLNTELPGGWAVTDNALAEWLNALLSALILSR